MAQPLARESDVEAALLRPLTSIESDYIQTLITQASALVRNTVPSIDSRVAAFAADPTDASGLDPDVAAAVTAGVVKRYLVNPKGLASESEATGPYSHSEAFALQIEKGARGVMQVTAEDIAALLPSRKRLRAGTIRTRPGLAPRPVGRYGGYPTAGQAIAAAVTYSPNLAPDGVDPLGFQEGQ